MAVVLEQARIEFDSIEQEPVQEQVLVVEQAHIPEQVLGKGTVEELEQAQELDMVVAAVLVQALDMELVE
jgi:hypothetical protein